MKIKGDAKFDQKLTCGLENHRALKSHKIGTLIVSFYPKQKIYEFKLYRGVMCHDSQE